jgi:hypothetical protein
MLTSTPFRLIACAALLFLTAPAEVEAQEIDSRWNVRIFDGQRQLKQEATLQFTDQPAKSCMRGKWKRLVVTPVGGADATFFPLTEPLAYKLQHGVLTIGRTSVCNRYLFLSGTSAERDIHGTYKAVSAGRSKQLGLFTMAPAP